MTPTTDADVARLMRLTAEEMTDCVLTHDQLKAVPVSGLPDIWEAPIIGAASPDEGLQGQFQVMPSRMTGFGILPGSRSCPNKLSLLYFFYSFFLIYAVSYYLPNVPKF